MSNLEKAQTPLRVQYALNNHDGTDRNATEKIEGPKLGRSVTIESSYRGVRLRRSTTVASDMSIRPHSVRSFGSPAFPAEYRTISIQLDREAAAVPVAADLDEIAADLLEVQWHKKSPSEVCEELKTSPKVGLNDEQCHNRIAQYGPNKPSPPPSNLLRRIFMYCFGGFGSLLLVGGVLVMIAWKPLGEPPQAANLALSVVLFVVFLVQAFFNAWQDWSSSKVMQSITGMLPDTVTVLRNGSYTDISATNLVPGDIISIRQGNSIPADMRFVEVSSDLKLDRSILTGESEAVPGTVHSTEDNYLETNCIAMQGSFCVCGSAVGVCVATGDNTVFGKIARSTNKPKNELTHLQKEVLRFVLVICSLVIAMVLVVVIAWVAWLRRDHRSWINVPTLIVDLTCVGIAFIPEGLPIAVTSCLTITAGVMKRNKILCKSLATVETLGAVSVICSDKTGTLTKNQMTVHFSVYDRPFTLPTSISLPKDVPPIALLWLRAISGLCNAAEFNVSTLDRPISERKINGDATDSAILRFSEAIGSVETLRRSFRSIYQLPFNSKNKFMLTVIGASDVKNTVPEELVDFVKDDEFVLMMKGAPDILINKCTKIMNADGTASDLTEESREAVQNLQIQWALDGKRVLGLVQKSIPKASFTNEPTNPAFADEALEAACELTFVGLIGIVDPLRDDTAETISILRQAGIRVFMVTGDFKLTAVAIARECGILTSRTVHDFTALQQNYTPVPMTQSQRTESMGDLASSEEFESIALDGSELMMLDEGQWSQLVQYREIVFARTTPGQKLKIVKQFQKHDIVVGMTGDGVNDAPSLKAADIGIAIGGGTDLAMEAADMVLLDQFSAIVSAIESGRLVFDNLRKTIAYLLPAGSFSELWPVMFNIFFGLPQNLSSFLMIVICCFTDCAGALSLAYEKPEQNILSRPPRDVKKNHLVDSKLLLHAYTIGFMECFCSMVLSYWHMKRRGLPFSALWLKYGSLDPRYDPAVAAQIVNEGSSIYFFTLVIMQFFNLLATRTRTLSVVQQPPIFNKRTQNLWIFPAMLFSLSTAFFFCYIPFFQKIIGSTQVPVEYFFLPVAFGMVVLLYDEGRKFCVRKWPKGVLAKLAW